ncbi:hypothetical protein LZC95_50575 [Pendulispora brunnea]|uniref:Uncharacterized protein n=1 Tax=Pendulispora brunnea TaxID=2905690 RepID=A0ABZ2K7I7_9BACT
MMPPAYIEPEPPPVFLGTAEVFARGEARVEEDVHGAAHASGQAHTALVSGAANARIMWAGIGGWLGPAAGLDFELGFATSAAGFVHGVRLEPAGLGLVLGKLGFLSAKTGAGFGGITGHGPTALEVPASAHLVLDAASRVRLLFDARILWAFARARADGAPHAPFGDEMRLGVGARIGQSWKEGRFQDAGGYFFRLEHSERFGAAYLGIAFGWELGGTSF